MQYICMRCLPGVTHIGARLCVHWEPGCKREGMYLFELLLAQFGLNVLGVNLCPVPGQHSSLVVQGVCWMAQQAMTTRCRVAHGPLRARAPCRDLRLTGPLFAAPSLSQEVGIGVTLIIGGEGTGDPAYPIVIVI